jgi:Adenine specific DNA methylase Mod
MINKLDMKTVDITANNIGKIGELFPNVIVESEKGKTIDFDLLKQELSSEIIEGNKEKYQLTWPGKRKAILAANTPTTKTLRPLKEKSVDFDNTQNIYIEGDNLEALKILQESYLNKIKCIYIDPPYNTGKNLIYKNDFSITDREELLKSGQIDELGNRLTYNLNSNGRFHSEWISMMYSRIKLARKLLKDDGVIVLAMDQSELINLVKICDEVFGEQNQLGIITVVHKPEGRNQEKFFATSNEYAIFYAKNKMKFDFEPVIFDEDKLKEFNRSDYRGRYKLNTLIAKNHGREGYDKNLKENSPIRHFPIYVSPDLTEIIYDNKLGYYEIYPTTKTQERTWKYIKETLTKKINEGEIIAEFDNQQLKLFEKYRIDKGQLVKTHWIDKKYNAINSGTRVLDELMKVKTFDFPKSLYLIMDTLKLCMKKNDIVLDLFSGSATTAHAIKQLNADDGGSRKYIMVQFAEYIDEESEAYKKGYETICDVGEERIRRAAKKIKEETNADIDYGFRVYKIDSSNMNDIKYKPNDLSQEQLNLFESNIKEDRTTLDILTQVILDLGLTLDLKIEEKQILDNDIYLVEDNALVACLDDKININIIDEICKINPLKVVFRDTAFETDSDKINLLEKIKKLSPETDISIL